MTSKRISVLFLIISAVLFVLLASAGFVADKMRQRSQQAASTVKPTVLPSTQPQSPRFFVKSADDRSVYATGKDITLIVYADSSNIPIEGFDLTFKTNPTAAVEVVSVESVHEGFTVTDSAKNGTISITGLKKVEEKGEIVFSDTAVAELVITTEVEGLLPIVFDFTAGSTTDSNMVDKSARDVLQSVTGLDLAIGRKIILSTDDPVDVDSIVTAVLTKTELSDAACRDCTDSVVIKIARGIEQKEIRFVSGGLIGQIAGYQDALGYRFHLERMSRDQVDVIAAPVK